MGTTMNSRISPEYVNVSDLVQGEPQQDCPYYRSFFSELPPTDEAVLPRNNVPDIDDEMLAVQDDRMIRFLQSFGWIDAESVDSEEPILEVEIFLPDRVTIDVLPLAVSMVDQTRHRISLEPLSTIPGRSIEATEIHPGNQLFQQLTGRYRGQYLSSRSRGAKAIIVDNITNEIMSTGGLLRAAHEGDHVIWSLATMEETKEHVRSALTLRRHADGLGNPKMQV